MDPLSFEVCIPPPCGTFIPVKKIFVSKKAEIMDKSGH
jgi:hypothetical protein